MGFVRRLVLGLGMLSLAVTVAAQQIYPAKQSDFWMSPSRALWQHIAALWL